MGTRQRQEIKNISNVLHGDIAEFNDFDGYENERQQAKKFLEPKKKYTVSILEIDYWHTKVFLKEFPNIPFNSVLFTFYSN